MKVAKAQPEDHRAAAPAPVRRDRSTAPKGESDKLFGQIPQPENYNVQGMSWFDRKSRRPADRHAAKHMVSQVDEAIFGRDLDGSEELDPKAQAQQQQRRLKAHQASSVDEIVFGRDLDQSSGVAAPVMKLEMKEGDRWTNPTRDARLAAHQVRVQGG